MRWQEICESSDQWYPITQLLEIYPEFNETQNLPNAVKWMSGISIDQCEVKLSVESIEIFRDQIDDMVEDFTAYPKERSRMKRIMVSLKEGERALPVFVDANDPTHHIIEGRHRVVAFDQLGMTKVIVARIRAME